MDAKSVPLVFRQSGRDDDVLPRGKLTVLPCFDSVGRICKGSPSYLNGALHRALGAKATQYKKELVRVDWLLRI